MVGIIVLGIWITLVAAYLLWQQVTGDLAGPSAPALVAPLPRTDAAADGALPVRAGAEGWALAGRVEA